MATKETDELQSEVIDLDFSVTEDDVLRPVLKDGTYDFTIAYTRSEESAEKKLPMMQVGYRLAQMAEDTRGKPVNPNFLIIQRYLLEPTGKMTREMVNRRFQEIHFAAAGEGRVNTGEWIGKTVRARVRVRDAHTDEESGREYPETNEIVRVMPKK